MESRGLLRSFIPSHTGDEDRKYMKGVARTGRSWSPTAHSCFGGVEHQGYRGCRPWELQLGGPAEEEEGEERMREVFYCVPG